MSKIKHFVQQSWLLIISSFFFGLLIAVTNAAWSGRILQNEIDKRNRLMSALIADANSFEIAVETTEISAGKGKVIKTNIYKALNSSGQTIGFAFIAAGSGFQDKIKLVIAVDAGCEKFLGYKVLASNETPNFGDKIKEDYFRDQFKGAPTGKLELVKTGDETKIDSEIVAISGATVSSEAVVKTFNTYIDKVKEQLQTKGLIK